MKILIATLALSTLLLLPRLLIADQTAKEDKTLGDIDDRLSRCPDTPNCVNSEYPEQAEHYVSPLNLSTANNKQIMHLAQKNLLAMGAHISSTDNHYLHATFTSRLFKFIDDFELRLDVANQKLHIRSASRTGYSDFGVNKRRVKEFIELMTDSLTDYHPK